MMQAVQTARLPAAGGATGPPLVLNDEPSSPVPVPVSDADQIAKRRQAFGHRLNTARHRSGVTLEDIAQRTKVSPSLLAALERGDASRWPKGLFRRAFFRDYMVAIGVPADPHITEFLQLFPDGEDHPISGPVARPESPAPLRLTLGAESMWRITREQIARELLYLTPILLLAGVLTMGIGVGPWIAAGMVGLGYYGRIVSTVAKRIALRRRGQPSGSS